MEMAESVYSIVHCAVELETNLRLKFDVVQSQRRPLLG